MRTALPNDALLAAVAVLLVAPAAHGDAPKPARPNLLFIVADDLGWSAVGDSPLNSENDPLRGQKNTLDEGGTRVCAPVLPKDLEGLPRESQGRNPSIAVGSPASSW